MRSSWFSFLEQLQAMSPGPDNLGFEESVNFRGVWVLQTCLIKVLGAKVDKVPLVPELSESPGWDLQH